MVNAVAYTLLGLATLSFAWNLWVSYTSRGGAIGQVPVLAPPIFHQAPLASAALFFFGMARHVPTPWWALLACFFGVATLSALATIWVGRLGR